MLNLIGDIIVAIFGLGVLAGALIVVFVVRNASRRARARLAFWARRPRSPYDF